MRILTILFNRQIVIYLGTNALAVYGVIVNISTFAPCCAYSVGQASQPIISTNFGGGRGDRIKETLRYALGTTAFFSIFWTALSMIIPQCIYSALYDTNSRCIGNRAIHFPVLWNFVPAIAVEHFFNLLFSDADKVQNCFH